MHGMTQFIEAGPVWISGVALVLAFIVLAKCADVFVESSVAIAERFHIPKMMIGIVLVSLATTAPELSVSLMSAMAGEPEMALGNAVGSVMCDCGLALALCGIISVNSIAVLPLVLRTTGTFLITAAILAFIFVLPDNTISRGEGLVLLGVFALNVIVLLYLRKRGTLKDTTELETLEGDVGLPPYRLAGLFLVSITGIILSSRFVVASAVTIARTFNVPETAIALTLVAVGTSVPEIATCITAARKGQGELAIGNIMGADIMNICWVAGASALVNDLTVTRKEVIFMFPAMLVMIGMTMIFLRTGHRLVRREGLALLAAYLLYIVSFFVVFRP